MSTLPCPHCLTQRCLVDRILADGRSVRMSTCTTGLLADLRTTGQTARTATDPVDLDAWVALGHANVWISQAVDPPFGRNMILLCPTLDVLAAHIAHGNTCAGQGLAYGDLCFIQQVAGGDEWLALRHGVAFDSITFEGIIARGEFSSHVARMMGATREQLEKSTW